MIIKKSGKQKVDTIHNSPDLLIKDISTLIDEAKNHVVREYNSTQVLLCWLIGKRIDEEVLKSERAEYGETIVTSLSKHLTFSYGKGYSRPNLFRMIRFAKSFPNREIVSTLSRQLSWSHFVLICAVDDELKRDFYAEMCRVQRWSVRTLVLLLLKSCAILEIFFLIRMTCVRQSTLLLMLSLELGTRKYGNRYQQLVPQTQDNLDASPKIY